MNSQKPIFLSEEEKLKARLNTTHTQRFWMLMRLIKLSQKLERATIVKPKS